MLSLRVIADLEDFENLGSMWNKILAKSLDNDVFSTREWIWCWWKHFGKKRSLRVLAAEENGEIVGLAPFALTEYSFLRAGKLRRIEFIGFPHADYNNFILVRNPSDCLRLFIEGLMKLSDWDLLDLRDIREQSVSANSLRILSNIEGAKLRLTNGTLCPCINLPRSIETFQSNLSRNMRRNLRKRLRKLRESYKVEFKTQRDFDSIDEAMEIFFNLHQKRWKSKGKQGAFAAEDFRKFHLDVAKVFDKKGWLDLHFLMANDEPVAAAYTFDYNSKKYGYLTGFDPEFGHFGVGNLLKLHLIEECIKKGFREYDLTREFEPYKAEWATVIRKNLIARIVRRSLSAKMYCWALENKFSQWLFTRLGVRLSVRE
ncbi:MAG: GNAT family N-acetyltransferase [Candidatus Bathyarchaeia archaeon]